MLPGLLETPPKQVPQEQSTPPQDAAPLRPQKPAKQPFSDYFNQK
jgi:hypothetical protein